MTASIQTQFEISVMRAERGGALVLSMRPSPQAAQGMLKSQQNRVTKADFEAGRFLFEHLAAVFPLDGFQGEGYNLPTA